MGRIVFLQRKGKACYCVFELSSQKAAVAVEVMATSSLVLGTVGFRKTHRVAVTLGVENKPSASLN